MPDFAAVIAPLGNLEPAQIFLLTGGTLAAMLVVWVAFLAGVLWARR